MYARNKRGVFDFIGGISKILFGTSDNEYANDYTDKITHLKNEQLDFLEFSKEQITLVKSDRSIRARDQLLSLSHSASQSPPSYQVLSIHPTLNFSAYALP
jgi:hypothetical protein